MFLHLLIHAIQTVENNRIHHVPVGGHLQNCHNCGQIQPHLLVRAVKRPSGLITKGREIEQYRASLCEVCHQETRHLADRHLRHIGRWYAGCNIQDFARITGHPPLAPNHQLITARSAEAMIQSIRRKAPSNIPLQTMDFVIGAGALAGTCAITLGFQLDNLRTHGDAIFVVFGAGFAALFITVTALVFTRMIRQKKTYWETAFQKRITRLGVSGESVLYQTPQHLLRNHRIYKMLRPNG